MKSYVNLNLLDHMEPIMVEEFSPYLYMSGATALVAVGMIQRAVEEVLDRYPQACEFHFIIECGIDDRGGAGVVRYHRPETQTEFKKRAGEVTKRKEQAEAKERAMLAELKKKYES